ncbi:MAG: hypothetical protein IJ725_00945, partial [Ruminococcus sp.]|nr:hypothetical protein [Ruminococcus sp.]
MKTRKHLRVISVILSALMLLSVISIVSAAATADGASGEEDGYKWTVDGNTLSVEGDSTGAIPDFIDA